MTRWFAALSCVVLLEGCCCFPFGHHGSSSTANDGSSATERYLAEKALKIATGGKVDVQENGNTMTVKTPDGTLTTFADDKLPAGFPYALQPGAEISGSTRMDPTDKTQPSTFMVSYDVKGTVADASAYWTKVGKGAGYQVHTAAGAAAEAIKEAEKEGVKIPSDSLAGTGSNDLVQWQTTDQQDVGSIMISQDDEDAGKLQVVVDVPVPGTLPKPAPAP